MGYDNEDGFTSDGFAYGAYGYYKLNEQTGNIEYVGFSTPVKTEAAQRKEYPLATGVLDYFPDALMEIAHVSYLGNQQHHPDKPLHWDRAKSTDEADAMLRHFKDRGTRDSDGGRHTAKAAWRLLALLQKEIEAERT
jgi:hypothetical protein